MEPLSMALNTTPMSDEKHRDKAKNKIVYNKQTLMIREQSIFIKEIKEIDENINMKTRD